MKKWNLILFIYFLNLFVIILFIDKIYLDYLVSNILAIILVYELIYFILSLNKIVKNKNIKMLDYKKEMNIYYYLVKILIIIVFASGTMEYYRVFAFSEIALISLFLEFINPIMYDKEKNDIYYGHKKISLNDIVGIEEGFNKLTIKYSSDVVVHRFTSEKRKRDLKNAIDSIKENK